MLSLFDFVILKKILTKRKLSLYIIAFLLKLCYNIYIKNYKKYIFIFGGIMEFYKEIPPSLLSEYDIEFFSVEVYHHGICVIATAHIHTAVEILYITKGEFKIDADGEQALARAGDIVLFRSNTVHSIYHLDDSHGQYYVLKLPSHFLFQTFKGGNNTDCIMPLLKSKKDDKVIFSASELPNTIKELWIKMISEYEAHQPMLFAMEKAYACAFIVSLYREFFAMAAKQSKNIYVSENIIPLIYESVEYINENYVSDISPTDCAKRANLSYSYYAKLFREVIGKSFKEYLTSLRLSKAHSILLVTDLTITDISLSCGYKSPSHFTAEYKKHYGVTPSETRYSAVRLP